MRVALADPQQGERGQQRIDEAADVPAEPPAARRSASIRRTSRSRSPRPATAKNYAAANGRGSATAIRTSTGEGADERARSSAAETPLASRQSGRARREGRLVEIGPQACRRTAVRHKPPATAGSSTDGPRPRCGSADRASGRSAVCSWRPSASSSIDRRVDLACDATLPRACGPPGNFGARAVIERDRPASGGRCQRSARPPARAARPVRRRTPNNRRSA